jgi:hypothetical protein
MNKDEAIANGTPYACLDCQRVYAEVPLDEDTLQIDSCSPKCNCGSSHLVDLREVEQIDYPNFPLDDVDFHEGPAS